MSFDAVANAGTTAVREGHRFDETALERWMRANVEGFDGDLTVEQFRGGQSNPTFKLRSGDRAYVLRRKPAGPLVKGAHAVEREARAMAALGRSGFPVPRVYGLCDDDSVIGSGFFVMEHVEGRIFWDATFPDVSANERRALFDEMNRVMANLHTIDPDAVGLGDFGRSGNYFERQIGRLSKQYFEDLDAGRDPDMDRLIDWLNERIPTDNETRIVHGDFRCDNLIFAIDAPRIVAVLDWELSTLGHPLADFAYHAMMFRMPPDIVAGLRGADLAALYIPTEQAYLAEYCRRTSRPMITEAEYAFYLAFNFFRLAAIIHGIRGRVLRGTATSAHARARGATFPRLVALALECT